MEKKQQQVSDGTNSIRVVSGGIILDGEGKIFLAKGVKFDGKYIVPGGGIDFGESIEDGAKREILEETGMEVETVDKLCFSEFLKEGGFYKKKHFVLCDLIFQFLGSKKDITLNDEYEKDSGDWFSVEVALNLDLGGNTREVVLSYQKYVELHDSLNGWKRCLADFENYKKRQSESGRELADRAVENILSGLLPVLDNLNASLAHVPEEHKSDPWVMGLTYIHKQFEDTLRDAGVEEVDVREGDVFDPEQHEAVEDGEQVSGDSEQGEEKKEGEAKVKKVVQKGYVYRGRVIRAARVLVRVG
jgi:molecular chaperone GrpE